MVKSYFKTNPRLSNDAKEIYKRPPKAFLPIIAMRLNEIWQCDLFFITNINVSTILSVIDIYSRRAWIVKVKTAKMKKNGKKAEDILESFKYAIEKLGAMPEVVMLDGGVEFQKSYSEYLKNNDIEKRVVEGDNLHNTNMKLKMSIVERFNSTARSLIKTYLIDNEQQTLTQNDLDKLSVSYNNHKHSTIDATPNEVWLGHKKPKRRMYKHNIEKVTLKVGNDVRLMYQYKSMEKGRKDKPVYSSKVYKILERYGNTFLISDGKEKFYPYTRLLLSNDKGEVYEKKKYVPKPAPVFERTITKSSLRKKKRVDYSAMGGGIGCSCRGGCRFCG